MTTGPLGGLRALAMLTALMAAACAAPTRWENPSLSERHWSADMAECRNRARSDSERDYARERTAMGRRAYDPTDPWATEMGRYDALKRRNAQFSTCMKDRGYRKVRRAPGG